MWGQDAPLEDRQEDHPGRNEDSAKALGEEINFIYMFLKTKLSPQVDMLLE